MLKRAKFRSKDTQIPAQHDCDEGLPILLLNGAAGIVGWKFDSSFQSFHWLCESLVKSSSARFEVDVPHKAGNLLTFHKTIAEFVNTLAHDEGSHFNLRRKRNLSSLVFVVGVRFRPKRLLLTLGMLLTIFCVMAPISSGVK